MSKTLDVKLEIGALKSKINILHRRLFYDAAHLFMFYEDAEIVRMIWKVREYNTRLKELNKLLDSIMEEEW